MLPHDRIPAPSPAYGGPAARPHVPGHAPQPPVAPGQHGIYGYGHNPGASTLSTAQPTSPSPEQLAAQASSRPACGQTSSTAPHVGAPAHAAPSGGHSQQSGASSEHHGAQQRAAASLGTESHFPSRPLGAQPGIAPTTRQPGLPTQAGGSVVGRGSP